MRTNTDDGFNFKLLVVLPIIVIFTYTIDIGVFEGSHVEGQYYNVTSNNTAIEADDLAFQGYDLYLLDNYTGAVEYYNKALSIDADNIYALKMKGVALDRIGNHSEATESFNKALAIDPLDSFALNSKSLALFGMGNYTEATEPFNKALAIDPLDSFALSVRDLVLPTVNLITEMNNHQGSDNIANLTKKKTPSDLQIGLHLIRDPESLGFLGDGYRINSDVGIYFVAGNDTSNYSIYQIPNYAQSLVQLSDSQISVDIAFKMPLYPKSTIESIERVKGTYDVKYLDTQPDYKRFIAYSDSPLTINNTQYSNLTIEVKKFNNDTGYFFIDGYK